jgi:hypothetical protein
MLSLVVFVFIVRSLLPYVVSIRSYVKNNSSRQPDPDNPFIDFEVDYEPFRQQIRNILRDSGPLHTSDCDVPDGAFIFTLSNHHLLPLLTLRHQIMTKAGSLQCIKKRFITVCLDKKCLELCSSNHLPNCVLLMIPETPYGEVGNKATAYTKNAYNYIVWVKYEMFVEALFVANEFFYMDADVMLFRNPFPDTRFGRNSMGKQIEGEYDIMYQRERGVKERGCGGSINGGLFWLRNTTVLHEDFFPALIKHREEIINFTGRLDQEVIGDYVRLVRYCTLPTARFMGHCFSSRDHYGYNVKDVVTYHTNCLTGLHNKVNAIHDFCHKYFGHPI